MRAVPKPNHSTDLNFEYTCLRSNFDKSITFANLTNADELNISMSL